MGDLTTLRRLGLAVLLCFPPLLLAGEEAAGGEADLQTYRQEQTALRVAIVDGEKPYDALNARQRRLAGEAIDETLNLTAGKHSHAGLNSSEQVQLYNAQQRLEAILGNTRQSAANQDECWQEREVGTKVMKTRCATKAEREEIRQETQDWLHRPKTCGKDCGGL